MTGRFRVVLVAVAVCTLVVAAVAFYSLRRGHLPADHQVAAPGVEAHGDGRQGGEGRPATEPALADGEVQLDAGFDPGDGLLDVILEGATLPEEIERLAEGSLTSIEIKRCEAVLSAAVHSQDAEVREAVAQAVYDLRMSEYAEELLPLLNDPEWDVRYAAALALTRAGVEGAAEVWEGLLRQRSAEGDLGRAWVAGELEDPRQVPFLSGLLARDEPAIRTQALCSLGRVATADAIGALKAYAPGSEAEGVLRDVALFRSCLALEPLRATTVGFDLEGLKQLFGAEDVSPEAKVRVLSELVACSPVSPEAVSDPGWLPLEFPHAFKLAELAQELAAATPEIAYQATRIRATLPYYSCLQALREASTDESEPGVQVVAAAGCLARHSHLVDTKWREWSSDALRALDASYDVAGQLGQPLRTREALALAILQDDRSPACQWLSAQGYVPDDLASSIRGALRDRKDPETGWTLPEEYEFWLGGLPLSRSDRAQSSPPTPSFWQLRSMGFNRMWNGWLNRGTPRLKVILADDRWDVFGTIDSIDLLYMACAERDLAPPLLGPNIIESLGNAPRNPFGPKADAGRRDGVR